MAKPSLNHRSAHVDSVTESPNHWCAISCAINATFPDGIPYVLLNPSDADRVNRLLVNTIALEFFPCRRNVSRRRSSRVCRTDNPRQFQQSTPARNCQPRIPSAPATRQNAARDTTSKSTSLSPARAVETGPRNDHAVRRNRCALRVRPGALTIRGCVNVVRRPLAITSSRAGAVMLNADRRFRGRMVQGRNPVVNSVGPVVADCRRLAVFIVGENQSVFWFAVVSDREG